MIKERELLRRAYELLDRRGKIENFDKRQQLLFEIYTYLSTPSDDAEEPEAKPVLYIKEQELLYIQVLKQEGLAQEWKSNLGLVKEAGDVGLYLHPPKPAEPEAEPVAWIKRQYAGTGNVLTSIFYCPEPGAIPLYTKPAEPEAETIETLKAENFKLASGQCTEGGPWGDEGGTPYCKYAARKPMTNEEIIQGVTVDTSDDFHAGYWAGIRFAEKHHGITDADL